MGWTSKIDPNKDGKKININLAPNPSHLETVGAVVEGISRAKIDNKFDGDSSKVLPIIVHGDAAIAGQGIAYEIAQMSGLKDILQEELSILLLIIKLVLPQTILMEGLVPIAQM